MSIFIAIGLAVPEKKILKAFYLVWTWRPFWSCDLDYQYIHWFPRPKMLHVKFGFYWPSGFREGELRIFL